MIGAWSSLPALAVASALGVAAGPPVAAPAQHNGGGAHPSAIRATAHDRAATDTYLRAAYAYERAVVANAPAGNAAAEAFAGKLGAECPGVLADAPGAPLEERFESRSRSARQRGEANRELRQHDDLYLEITYAFLRASLQPDLAAGLAYARAVRHLRWSSRDLTDEVRASAIGVVRELRSTSAPCSDMRYWVQSGYRSLSPQTKALLRALPYYDIEPAVRGEAKALKSYAGPRGKALEHKTKRLELRYVASLRTLERAFERLRHALGIQNFEEEREEPPKGAVVLLRGKTASGAAYVIWIVPPASQGASGAGCSISIEYQVNEAHSGSRSGGCLSRSHPERLQVFCQGQRYQIDGQTAEGATVVRVRLRGGGEVASPVALVPPSHGGPAGFYFQLLRPSQVPVTLEELGAEGRALATIKFPHKRECARERPRGPAPPKPPESLGGGVIVKGHIPHGPRFQIIGERSRFMEQIESHFSVLVFQGPSAGILGAAREPAEPQLPARSPFALQAEVSCQPHEYALIYGLLRVPRDTVLVRTGGALRPLRKVPIPARLHIPGVLAYIALPRLPSAVIVRSAAGRAIVRKSLARSVREDKETCEGESEGPA